MKKILIAVLLFTTVIAAAQTKPAEDSIINLMKNDLCKELEKVPASDFTAENFQTKLGMQMLGVFQKYNDDLTVLYGENYITDKTATYEIGKKIGMQLGVSCKAFQDILMNNPEIMNAAMGKTGGNKPNTNNLAKGIEGVKAEAKPISGKVMTFTPGPISFFTIKDNNQLLKVYWLTEFEGDDELIANPHKIIGKYCYFKVTETKIFDAKSKVYKKIAAIILYGGEIKDEEVIIEEKN